MASGIEFGTRYGERVRVPSNPGCDVSPVYSARFDDHGRLVLEQVGEKNVFEEIQSHRDEVDLQRILQRYNAGETDILNQVQGFFGDVSGMPTTFPEFFNLMKRSREFFDGLPPAVRQNFGNSFETFVTATQRPDFASMLHSDYQAINPQTIKKEGVDSSEPQHAE